MLRPPSQRVLMTYTADLATALMLLFEKVTQSSSSETPTTTWLTLKEVYQAYKVSDTRRKIYRRIDAEFQQGRQIRDQYSLCRLLLEQLGSGPIPDPTITPPLPPQVLTPPPRVLSPPQRIRLPVWYHLSPCFAPPSQHS